MMPGKLWQDNEDAYLRDCYGKEPVAVTASNLNRTLKSVYQRATLLGFQEKRCTLSESQVRELLTELHPQGYSDAEIRQVAIDRFGMRVERHRIGRVRRDMRLPTNTASERRRSQIADRTRQQIAKAGLNTIGDLRRLAFDKWKRDHGWPDHLTMRAAMAAELFYRRGPMTRAQLCHALGLPAEAVKCRTQPKSNAKGGTVMAELMRAGLLMCLPRQVRSGFDHRGGVRKVHLYLLNPGVRPNAEECKLVEDS